MRSLNRTNEHTRDANKELRSKATSQPFDSIDYATRSDQIRFSPSSKWFLFLTYEADIFFLPQKAGEIKISALFEKRIYDSLFEARY